MKPKISLRDRFSLCRKERQIQRYRALSLLVLFVLSLAGLCSCDASSSGTMYAADSSSYSKKIRSKYSPYPKEGEANNNEWLVDDTKITVSTGNFWDRLRGSFQLAHQADNPKVKAQIKWFIRHQGYLNRSVKRASPYIYYIFQQVQKRNLPGELILLPFVESAFNPFAYSGPGAAGLWQLMPHTGTGFGLKQNWWYDGRRDVHASTNAALDYLTYLQNFFDGDWLLAIAAYNTGEGNVQHAVRRNARAGLSTDFFSLGLAQETQAYVPQILALATIISNPQDYPIKLPPLADEPYLAEVNIGYQIDLTEAAHLACISVDEIHRLNPAYMHKLTGPRSPCCLLLPIDHVEVFKANLAKLSVVNRTTLQRYKVKRRESVESIAARFQISSYKLRRINHLKTNAVRSGRVIFVPVESPRITADTANAEEKTNAKDVEAIAQKSSDVSENRESTQKSEAVETEKTQPAENEPASVVGGENESDHAENVSTVHVEKILHRVKKGETLQRIAARYHVKPHDLEKCNHITRRAKLKPGKTLVILQKTQSSEPATSKQRASHSPNRNERNAAHKTSKVVVKQSPQKSKNARLARTSKVKQGNTLSRSTKKHPVRAAKTKHRSQPSQRGTHTRDKH